MWNKIKAFVTQYWKQLLEIVGGLIAIFALKDEFQQSLKSQLKTQETQAKADVIEERKSILGENIQKLADANQTELNKLTDTEKKLPDMNHQQVEDYYNKK